MSKSKERKVFRKLSKGGGDKPVVLSTDLSTVSIEGGEANRSKHKSKNTEIFSQNISKNESMQALLKP